VTVKKGDPIKARERLGLAGQSGDAERPELHFEIRRGDEAVDPAPLLRLRKEG
jgi:murein DD-endopeptidase MepM/ murein hydrolase activator NlpD